MSNFGEQRPSWPQSPTDLRVFAIKIRKLGRERHEHPADYEPVADALLWAADEIESWKRLTKRDAKSD